MDSRSLGFLKDKTNPTYSTILSLSERVKSTSNFSNCKRLQRKLVGTFNSNLTNILPKVNKPSGFGHPQILFSPLQNFSTKDENLSGFEADDMTVYELSSIVNLLGGICPA